MKSWTRRTALPVVVPAMGLVGIAWFACTQGMVVLQHRHVAMPPSTAEPQDVVAAYLDALNAHDCATARRLSDDGDADLWCEDVLRLKNINIDDPVWQDVPQPGPGGQQLATVWVTFDLNWRLGHDDGSMPEGPTGWGYTLARDSTDQPWRIDNEGVG